MPMGHITGSTSATSGSTSATRPSLSLNVLICRIHTFL